MAFKGPFQPKLFYDSVILMPGPTGCGSLASYTQCQLIAKSWCEGGAGRSLSVGSPLLPLGAAFKLKVLPFTPAGTWSHTSLILTLAH